MSLKLAAFGYEIMRPDDESLSEYNDFVEPMFRQMLVLSRQNAKLAAARDLLLPRLMSGKLEVA